MKRLVTAVCLVSLLVLVTSGCATLMKGTTQTISVSSNVDGAEISLDGMPIGRTPFTGPVKKNKSTLVIDMEGYRRETVALSKSLEPMFWGNIIIGGTIGSITDFATGAAYQYAPASYQVDLQRADQADEDFLKEVAVRKFSMIYIDELSADLSKGEGDYLSALISILDWAGAQRVDGATIREALTRSGGDPIRFGNNAVALR